MEVREAAAYASRTPETVRRWIWSGRLTATRRGNRLLVRRSDLDALTDQRNVASLTLREWAALLPQHVEGDGDGGSGTAADLVLAERDRRAGR